ncbi:MAG: hypothetical protein ACXWTN_07225, partial [Methylosarcina sp.]
MTLPYFLQVSGQKNHNVKAGISDSQIAKSVLFLLDFALAFCYPVISYGIEDRQIFEMPLEELL